jgi:hypothetical protein
MSTYSQHLYPECRGYLRRPPTDRADTDEDHGLPGQLKDVLADASCPRAVFLGADC